MRENSTVTRSVGWWLGLALAAGAAVAQPAAESPAHTGQPTAGAAATAPAAQPAAAAQTTSPTADPDETARQYFSDLEVVNQDGKPLRFYSDVLKGRVVLINFIFTNCQDACPMMTRKLIQTRAMMAEPIRDKVLFVSISIDPERDTPQAMKEFMAKQGVDDENWVFLTGQPANLTHIVKKLGQYTEEVEAHSTLMIAGNVRTRHWTMVLPMVPPQGIAQQLRGLVEEG